MYRRSGERVVKLGKNWLAKPNKSEGIKHTDKICANLCNQWQKLSGLQQQMLSDLTEKINRIKDKISSQ